MVSSWRFQVEALAAAAALRDLWIRAAQRSGGLLDWNVFSSDRSSGVELMLQHLDSDWITLEGVSLSVVGLC